MRLNEEKEKCNNRILMHFQTALLLSQTEMVHEKAMVFCCILRTYVFAQMSRKLQTDRFGMSLVEEKKEKEGPEQPVLQKLSHSPILSQKGVMNEVLFYF